MHYKRQKKAVSAGWGNGSFISFHMMQVTCTFFQKCSKFDAGSILINATNSKDKSSLLTTELISLFSWVSVPVFASLRSRGRVSGTLYDLYHLYFSAEVMVQSTRKARGHFMAFTEITIHPIECKPGNTSFSFVTVKAKMDNTDFPFHHFCRSFFAAVCLLT